MYGRQLFITVNERLPQETSKPVGLKLFITVKGKKNGNKKNEFNLLFPPGLPPPGCLNDIYIIKTVCVWQVSIREG